MKTEKPDQPSLPAWIVTQEEKIGGRKFRQIAHTDSYCVVEAPLGNGASVYHVFGFEWYYDRPATVFATPLRSYYHSRGPGWALRYMRRLQADFEAEWKDQ